MAVQEKLYTAEDLWELSHSADYVNLRLELSEGELIVMSPASYKHGTTAAKFLRHIDTFVEEHDLGETTAAETGFILFKNPDGRDTVRAPDVGFVAKGRMPENFDDGYAPIAPDLAVEVMSPNDSADEIEKKVQEYLSAGVRMVVVVYPATKSVTVHTPKGIRRITLDEAFDGEDVLPGFSLPLKKFFGG